MGRSNSRSHSSRSKSRSQSSSRSRSRSHSRKKRYSSRSRSRTYSRSRSRDRMYSRDYRRDYRNNRGMRRPYGYRGRGRGYYQGGGGRYHRGGYRPVWNRRHSRSPRRGRSRSRSPKRRSVSSQRSRSRSRRSYRSSRSPRSSSSRSSSPYSKSPVSKRRGSQEKQTKKAEGEPQEESPLKSKSQEEPKDTFEHDPSESIDEFNKSSATSGDIWPGLSAYDNSPRSPHSPSPIATPPSQSSSCSDAPMLSTVHSAKILLLSIHIPFSIVLKGLGLVLLEMDLVDTVPLRIVQFITSLHEEVLQRQSHHRMLQEMSLGAVPHFILMVEIRKLQRLGSS